MDRAGDAVEQPRMIGGGDGDQRRPPVGVDLRVNGEVRALAPRHQAGVVEENLVGLGDPVGFRQAADVRGEAIVVPAQRLLKQRLLARDALGPAALLVPEAKHLLRRLVQLIQQLHTPGPTARMSTTVSASSSRNRSGL